MCPAHLTLGVPPIHVATLSPGARVHHELRVAEREVRKTRNGDPFVVLTLGNRHGEIRTAPIWSDKMHWADGAERGAIVQAIGEVRTYADGMKVKRQLELSGPLRLVAATAVNLDDFLPRVDDDLAALWASLDKLRNEISSSKLRRVVGLFFDDDLFRLQFERAPGSTKGHHAKVGGLLRHVTEVAFIARTIANTMKSGSVNPVSLDLVTTGALLHDVGKVEAYRVSAAGFDTTPCGHLLGHVVLGALMLERRHTAAGGDAICSEPQLLELQHMILSHHGSLEFGSPVRPMTIEAEIIHWADESSAKANSVVESFGDPDNFASGGEFSERVWMMDNRRLWQKPHDWE